MFTVQKEGRVYKFPTEAEAINHIVSKRANYNDVAFDSVREEYFRGALFNGGWTFIRAPVGPRSIDIHAALFQMESAGRAR